MQRLYVFMFMVCGVLALALPSATQAATIISWQSTGLDAGAVFGTTDPSGCVFSQVRVGAVDGRVKQAGQPTSPSQVYVLVSEYNACTDTGLLAAAGQASLPADTFVVDGQLNTARLVTTAAVYDYVSETTKTVTIDVAWTATGGAVREKGGETTRSEDFLVKERFDATVRGATAAGTVSVDGGPNRTPESAAGAQMRSIRSSVLEITR
jgi:hypothetical protein